MTTPRPVSQPDHEPVYYGSSPVPSCCVFHASRPVSQPAERERLATAAGRALRDEYAEWFDRQGWDAEGWDREASIAGLTASIQAIEEEAAGVRLSGDDEGLRAAARWVSRDGRATEHWGGLRWSISDEAFSALRQALTPPATGEPSE